MAEDNPFLGFENNTAMRQRPRSAPPKRSDPILARVNTPAAVKNGQRLTAAGLPFYKDISKTGAPSNVRAAVASVQKNKDQLNALQKYYPTARPYGTDNFIFRDPKNSNKWTIFNPTGIDRGDFAANGRIVASTVGGVLGGVAGTAVAPGAGTLAGGAVGATGGGVLYDKGVQYLTGAEDTRTTGQQAGDAVLETALNAAIPAALGKGVKALRNVGRSGEQAVVGAFDNLGARAPVVSSGGTASKRTAAALQSSPLSAQRMVDRATQAVDDISAGVRRVTDTFAGKVATKADAGKIIKDSADTYVRDFRTTSTSLYDKVDELVAPDTRVAFKGFVDKIDEINGRYSGDPEFSDLLKDEGMKKLIDATDAAVQRGGVTYQTLKDLRSMLGQQINSGKGKIIDMFGSADTNALYGSLSDDMTLAARTVGGVEGEQAALAASKFWKDGRQVIDTRLQPVIGAPKTNVAPEKVYTNFMEVTEKTPSALGDWQTVIPTAQRETLGAYTLRELGNAPKTAEGVLVDAAGGATFNPNRFVSGYNQYFNNANGATAKGFFFPNSTLSETADSAFVAANSLKNAALENNASRSATTAMTAGTIGGVLSAIPDIASGIAADAPWMIGSEAGMAGLGAAAAWTAASNPLARVLTNPAVERMLARPALTEALPEITSRMPQWAIPGARSLIGETMQAPSRQELNFDPNATTQQPAPQGGVLAVDPNNPFAQYER